MSTAESSGRTPRTVVALMMAIIAAAFVFTFLLEERPTDPGAAEGLTGFATTQVISQAFGGAIVGWLLAALFGRGGVPGWVLSVIGGTLATLLAGAVGGLIFSLPTMLSSGFEIQEAINIGIGALTVPLAAAGRPLVLVVWLVLILLTHIIAKRARAGSV
ncbi:hypothetical protein CLV78_101564 [Aliiruegeria haliotis]|uniref:Uncharacterized protein n=1 Tax=Aliiruegeria haliotis TaxID=1280846 RepID=A0A2T0RZ74_9RHOB|nr:hypothetical protein [Aliiruegeria haliotis]PRY26468.1 hypothetical protein CLV78_101564 [Aliiruegeria haliotis]